MYDNDNSSSEKFREKLEMFLKSWPTETVSKLFLVFIGQVLGLVIVTKSVYLFICLFIFVDFFSLSI